MFKSTAGQIALGYLSAAIVMVVLDFGWIAMVSGPLFRRAFGDMLLEKPRALPAVLFYLLYPAALLFLTGARGETWTEAAVRGAVAGALAYGTFDLSNLALFKNYTTPIAVADMAWGICLSAVVAAVGCAVATRHAS